jgi:CRISPR-associated protein (TIGR03986 family)
MDKRHSGKPNYPSRSSQPSGSQGRGLARAPYNFVPLPEKVVPAQELPDHDCYHEDRHSGYFTVTLTTETPLYIRGMLTEKEAAEQARDQSKHKDEPDFFQRHDKPVIPGSSLRGMLRTLVEIIAFGKLTRVSDKPKIFFRAVAAKADDPLGGKYKEVVGPLGKHVQAGYLERKGDAWFIRPARARGGRTYDKVRDLEERGRIAQSIRNVRDVIHLNEEGYHVQYHDVKLERAEPPLAVRSLRQGERRDGVLVCTGNMAESSGAIGGRVTTNRRNFVIVYEADDRATPLEIDPQAVEDYRDGLTPFLTEKPFDPEYGCLVEGRPVFYIRPSQGEKVMYFGHAPFFRIAATLVTADGEKRAVTPRDMIPEAVRDKPDHYDIAEALFGYIDKGDPNRHKQGDKCRAYASRVSVSDAVVEGAQTDFYEAEFVPKVLGGPKPTTFQHYLEQPREAYKEKSKLHHYATVPRPKIRGHKRYWLQRIKGIDSVRETDTSKYGDTQHTRMKPVKAGITFKFTVRFENLSDVELGALAWALYLPCSPEHRHQLGMGKPYGMGMVKLEPTLHVIDRQARYTQLFDGDRWATAEREESAEQFIAAFEKYIADKLGNGKRFRDLQRICELNVMLTPQAPDKKFTYMTIEPENEYKDRPVLPRPSEVIGSACAGDAPSRSAALSESETRYKVGDVVEGRVVENAPANKPFRVKLDEAYGGAVVTAQGDSTARAEGNRVYLQVVEGNPRFKPISKKEAEALRRSKQG